MFGQGSVGSEHCDMISVGTVVVVLSGVSALPAPLPAPHVNTQGLGSSVYSYGTYYNVGFIRI